MENITLLNLAKNPVLQKHHQENLLSRNSDTIDNHLASNTALHQDVADSLLERHKGNPQAISGIVSNEGIKIKPEHQLNLTDASHYKGNIQSYPNVLRALSNRAETTKETFNKIHDVSLRSTHPSFSYPLRGLADNPAYTPSIEHTKKIMESSHGLGFGTHVLENDSEGKFGKEHVDHIINSIAENRDKHSQSSTSALDTRFRNPNIGDEHYHKLVDAGYNPSVASDKLSKEVIDKIIDKNPMMNDVSEQHKVALLNQRKFDESHLSKFIGVGNMSPDILQHPKITTKTLDTAIQNSNLETKKNILKSPAAQKHHYENAASDVRLHGFLSASPRTPPSILTKLADSKYAHVRENVVNNANTDKGIRDRLKTSLLSEMSEYLRRDPTFFNNKLKPKMDVLSTSEEYTLDKNLSVGGRKVYQNKDKDEYHMYHENDDGTKHSFSTFKKDPDHGNFVHEISSKFSHPDSSLIKDNIKLMHSIAKTPIISGKIQTDGGASIWERWGSPYVSRYKREKDGYKKVPNEGDLIDGKPETRMGYHDDSI